jgi:hypothetical protein
MDEMGVIRMVPSSVLKSGLPTPYRRVRAELYSMHEKYRMLFAVRFEADGENTRIVGEAGITPFKRHVRPAEDRSEMKNPMVSAIRLRRTWGTPRRRPTRWC